MKLNRYQAFSVHLTFSIVIATAVFLFIKFIWYPGALFSAAAGADLLKILIVVDMMLGPVITLIIFNPSKKYLKLDLVIILLCQLAFMVYGVWSIYSARPVYIVFVKNKFELVTANQIERSDQQKVRDPDFKSLPLFGPQFVGADLPTDPKIQNDILFAGLSGMGVQNLPQYFVSYEQVKTNVLRSASPVSALKNIDSKTRDRLAIFAQQQNFPVLFLPLRNKHQQAFVAINSTNGQQIEIL